ncbi:hypothetical protein C8J56DRAFT_968898 [Mycena floridula]|nr:hypothetical protein C8J56DRAFT_968898 [Mycena floridula]
MTAHHSARAIQLWIVVGSVLFLGLGYSSFALFQKESRIAGSLTFEVPQRDPVGMFISYSSHYQVDTEEGAQEFAHLLPESGYLVHLQDEEDPTRSKPYTVALFHQLKCLDLIRQQYIGPEDGPILPFTRHCLNYLRQSILCCPNLRIESAKNTDGTANRFYDTACHDWTATYEAADNNHNQFLAWKLTK